MATRKKKETLENVPSGGWPKMTQGTHLTVATYEDGSTKLYWDDVALEREVKDAIEQYELNQLKPAVKAKAATRKKKA
jgi:hypothetical protein